MLVVSALASGTQSVAEPGQAPSTPAPSPVTASAPDDSAVAYAAQAKGLQRPVAAVPAALAASGATGSVAGLPGAVVPPGALLELPSGPLGIPGAVLVAYRKVADELAASTPGCHMTWNLLAGIGRIESGHASGGRVDAAGTTLGPILGPVLDGANPGDGVVRDTDGGRLDGNTTYDRAVGPMQFIPGTWAVYGADGNGDGVVDPNNVYDAALGAGRYLCSGGLDVADPAQARTAVYRYNNSDAYVSNVLAWSAAYARGVEPTASELGPVPAPATAAPSTPAAPSATPAAPTTPAVPTTTPAAPTSTTPPPATTTTTPPPATTTTTPAPTTTPAATSRWLAGPLGLPVCGADTVMPVDPAAPDGATRAVPANPGLCLVPDLARLAPGYRELPPA
ncbi:lytic transglycosylase domain-containing protein [Rhodococcus aerolatus]